MADDDELAPVEGSVHDREFLARHRAALLASQRIAAGDLAARARAPWRGDLVIASLHTLYALPLGVWVLGQAKGSAGAGAPVVLVFLAALFGVVLWRSFLRSWRAARAQTYEGRFLRQRVEHAVFDGGEVLLPEELQRQLVPGVRYRVHRMPSGDEEEVAVDVALDDVDVTQGAYR
jgi:hypothetical protein